MDTPTPATLPDGWHVTTFGAVREIGRGELSVAFDTCYAEPHVATFLPWDDTAWRLHGYKQPVVWREAPPKLLPVMLPSDVAQRYGVGAPLTTADVAAIAKACRAALDGEA